MNKKIIIVEGTTDKRKVKKIVRENVDIICTNGTISESRLEDLMDQIIEKDIYVLVDADKDGEKLRKLFIRSYPEVNHIYIDKSFREVATTPDHYLASVLLAANIDVHTFYLEKG